MEGNKQSSTPITGWFSRFGRRFSSSDNLSSAADKQQVNDIKHTVVPRRSSAPIEWKTSQSPSDSGGKLTNRQSTIPSLVESSDRHGSSAQTNPLDVSELHLFESITSCTHDIVEREWNRRCYEEKKKEVELMNDTDDIEQTSKDQHEDQQEGSSYEVRELIKLKQRHEEQWDKNNERKKKNEEEEEDMIHTSWIMNERGGVRSYQYRVQRSMSSEHLNDEKDVNNNNNNTADDSLRSDYTWQTYNEPESLATVHIICSDTDTDGSYKEENSTVKSNTKEEEGEDYTSKSSLEILQADLASATDLVNNPTEETKLDISEMIQLKLLIANQQATIDTLSTQLHNLRSSDSKASRIHALEMENDILTKQLTACQESNFDFNNYQRRATLEISNKEDDKVLNENISDIRHEISKLQMKRTSSGSSSGRGSMMKKQGSTRRTGVRRGSIQRSNVTAPTVVMSEESDRSEDVLQF